MTKPSKANPITVRLSAEDAADLQERVDRGEFASLDEGVAAELAELNYRRAADLVGGSEELEALLDELIDEEIAPAEKVAGNISLSEMLADLKAQAKAADE
jgi:Arc/MetJ-type ribon-helix-helix transcriptional regulator